MCIRDSLCVRADINSNKLHSGDYTRTHALLVDRTHTRRQNVNDVVHQGVSQQMTEALFDACCDLSNNTWIWDSQSGKEAEQ
eukprot:5403877-Amphidinium_carterae.1